MTLTMEELKFSLSFKLMDLAFKICDFISPRINILENSATETHHNIESHLLKIKIAGKVFLKGFIY